MPAKRVPTSYYKAKGLPPACPVEQHYNAWAKLLYLEHDLKFVLGKLRPSRRRNTQIKGRAPWSKSQTAFLSAHMLRDTRTQREREDFRYVV